jgi:hypothetical protein
MKIQRKGINNKKKLRKYMLKSQRKKNQIQGCCISPLTPLKETTIIKGMTRERDNQHGGTWRTKKMHVDITVAQRRHGSQEEIRVKIKKRS